MSSDRHIKAAEGWLELGDFGSAMSALDRLPAESRASATVLRLRWLIYAKAGRWSDALEIAEGTLQAYPKNLEHRINYVWSLHQCGKSAHAAHYIAIMVEQATSPHFPHSWRTSYKVACLACKVGELGSARTALAAAFEQADDPEALKLKSLDDPDLQPLWVAGHS